MKIHYNVTGNDRKALVKAIGEITESKVKYKGPPTFNYEIDYFTVDKDGVLEFDDSADSEEIENLIEKLFEKGFDPNPKENTALTIEIPCTGFKENAIDNLKGLILSKQSLIKKALDIDNTDIVITENSISFPWFISSNEKEEIAAYTHFVTALCNLAKSLNRINNTEKDVPNEKYAFRCFLLRLGFIGDEYKSIRKILLKNFTGSSAFKNKPEEVQGDE